jgi:hypothetical protein
MLKASCWSQVRPSFVAAQHRIDLRVIEKLADH